MFLIGNQGKYLLTSSSLRIRKRAFMSSSVNFLRINRSISNVGVFINSTIFSYTIYYMGHINSTVVFNNRINRAHVIAKCHFLRCNIRISNY